MKFNRNWPFSAGYGLLCLVLMLGLVFFMRSQWRSGGQDAALRSGSAMNPHFPDPLPAEESGLVVNLRSQRAPDGLELAGEPWDIAFSIQEEEFERKEPADGTAVGEAARMETDPSGLLSPLSPLHPSNSSKDDLTRQAKMAWEDGSDGRPNILFIQGPNQTMLLPDEDLPSSPLPDGNSISATASMDPKWERIERTVQQLHDLQYPPTDTAKERELALSLHTVERAAPSARVGGFYRDDRWEEEGGFHTLTTRKDAAAPAGHTIAAEVYEAQRIEPGSWVRLRLLVPIKVEEKELPAGLRVFGRAMRQDDRLLLTVNSLRWADQIISVRLELYDQDGQKGFYVPKREREVSSASQWAAEASGREAQKRGWPLIDQGGRSIQRLFRPGERSLRLDLPPRYRVYLVNQNQRP